MVESGNIAANSVDRIFSVEQRPDSLGSHHPRAHPSMAAGSSRYTLDSDQWIGARLAWLLPLVSPVRPHQYR